MAAVMNARQDRQPTISFTLPISCQVCLGKVKQPVLCPNNHVFCSPCMDMWMQRNHQCPACRTPINPSNPVKHIKGGLIQAEETSDTMSNPSLRKARFDLLYKEYEDEFVRLESESRHLKSENSILKDQLKKGGGKSGGSERSEFVHPDSLDGGNLLALTKKLQDAQKLYERLKTDMSRVKQENNSLKDENVNLNRENEKLRIGMASRSPQRYGRCTVATLESKNEINEKEIRQLNKALQRSDKYVEDLETELSNMKKPSASSVRSSSVPPKSSSSDLYMKSDQGDQLDNPPENPAKRQLFGSSMDDLRGLSSGDTTDDRLWRSTATGGGGGGYNEKGDSTLWSSMNGSRNSRPKSKSGGSDDQLSRSSRGRPASASPMKDKSPKKVHFSLPKRTETSSFELDQPSPQNPSSSLGSISLSNGRASPSDIDSKYFDDKYTSKYSPTHSSKWYGDISDGDFDKKGKSDVKTKDRFEDRFEIDSSQLSMPEFESMPTKRSRYGNDLEMSDLDDTQTIRSELDDLNISLTPELSDCMKLLNRAEKKSCVSEGAGVSSAYPVDKYSSIPSSSSLSTAPAQPFRSGSDLPMTQWEQVYYGQVKSNPYKSQSVSQGTVGSHDRMSSSGGGLNYDSQAIRQLTNNSASYAPASSYTVPYTGTSSLSHEGPGKSATSKAAGDVRSLDDKLFLLGVTGDRNRVPNSDLLDSKSFPKSDDILSSYDSYTSSRKVPPSSFHSSLPITTTAHSGQSQLPPRDPNHRRSSLDYGKDLYLDPLTSTGPQNLLASQTSGRKYSSLNNIPAAVSASSMSGYSGTTASHLQKLNQLFPTSSSASSLSLRASSYSSSSSSAHPQAMSSNPSFLFAGSASAAGAAASSLPSSYSTSMSRMTAPLSSSSSTLSSAVTCHSAHTYPISTTSYSSSAMGSSSAKLSSKDDYGYPVGNSNNNNRKSNYSYESTTELSSSFVPDPKKRLFESGDDFDLTLSPIKSTRIT